MHRARGVLLQRQQLHTHHHHHQLQQQHLHQQPLSGWRSSSSQNTPTPRCTTIVADRRRRVAAAAAAAGSESSDAAATQQQQQQQGGAPEDVLQQLSLLRRQLEVSVNSEDYTRAKQLKEQADALKQQLSPVQQFVQAQLERLASGPTAADKAAAIKGLGEVGGEECLPDLAGCLREPELSDAASAAMWAVFSRPPAAAAAAEDAAELGQLMAAGVAFMEQGQLPLALEAFDAACKRCPSFAEAHNKRATVMYLLKDYTASIEVCRLTLELNPWHFGAASGMGMCYVALQHPKKAIEAFDRALAIHPGLSHVQHLADALRTNFESGSSSPSSGGGGADDE